MTFITVRDLLGSAAGRRRPRTLRYQLHDGRSFSVRIVRTPVGFGGHRAWMLCPGCDRRIGRLFVPVTGEPACRACARFPYEQRRLHRDRYWESWGRLAARLARVRRELARRYLRLARRGQLEREAAELEAALCAALARTTLESCAASGMSGP